MRKVLLSLAAVCLLVGVVTISGLAGSFVRLVQAQTAAPVEPKWHSGGQGLENARNQPTEWRIRPGNVNKLHVKWSFTTGGNVTATPTVAGDTVYFPDGSGNLFAVGKSDGKLLWSRTLSEYTGVARAVSRSSPAIHGHHLYFGDQLGTNSVRTGADLISVDRDTGALEWITQVDSHPAAIITGAPLVFEGVVYVGVSSGEEGSAESATYPCCTFRGSLVAVNARTGKVLWKTYTVPENGGKPGGYSGGAVWAPPAIDAARRTIYIGTGNNYTVPASVVSCQKAHPQADCAAANDYFDSVMALDLDTGHLKWGKRLQGFDVFTLACIRPLAPPANCPLPSSPDFDFGSGPNLMGNLVGIGQKSGIYWALDAQTGNIVWSTPVGPSGSLGGVLWGTATDGDRIYVAIGNNEHQSYKLTPSGETITWGAWSALDVRTGKILWQTADPTSGASDPGAVSVANGVMYAGSNSGMMYALDAVHGRVLWKFNSNGSVADGPAIVGNTVYWGSGYGQGTRNNQLFAFGLE